jgi:two-component system, cell cycle sensor histidine kinase and response regulator CckA
MNRTQPIVLIVDDSAVDRSTYRRYLQQKGEPYSILEAELGVEGLELCQRYQPDVVLVDYRLPDLDGIDFLNKLQTQIHNPPIIILTGQGNEAIAVETMKAGAQDYLIKGYLTPEKLRIAVIGVLEKAQLRLQLERSEAERRQAETALRQANDELERRVAERTAELMKSNEALQATLVERQQAEVFLRQVENDLREKNAALSNALEGISRLDVEGRYIAINEAYARITGYEADEMLGMNWQRTVYPEDLKVLMSAYDTMLRNGKVEVEARGVRKDGSLFYKQLFMMTAYNDQNQMTGHHCFLRDISDRKRSEQQIRQQAELLNLVSDAIFVRDRSNHIVFWSHGAERVYGWQSSEVLGRNARELLWSELEVAWDVAWETVLKTGEWHGELQKVTKLGKPITVASRWTIVRDETGQPKSILTVDTDITEKKQLEQQSLRNQRLESVGTLANGIAHDLNNILTPILAIAQLLPLKFPELDEQTQDLLKMLETSTKRGAALVNQVLTFTRGVEGRLVPLQVGYLLLETQKIAKQTFPKSIALRVNLPPDLWLISGDATQIHQVLMNLCVNARDAMPHGGTLTLSASNLWLKENDPQKPLDAPAGAYIAISVADTGTGMPPEITARIFDPFFTTKEIGKGTGLGLSTTIGILKSHKGFINVSSDVGKGTEFKVFLPAIDTATMEPVKEPTKLETPQVTQKLILVVDDEVTIRTVTQATLEAHQCRVLAASDGREAIEQYAQHSDIDLVILDMMMPSMDGQTTIRALKKIDPGVKVIAVSGLASNKEIALEAGANAFLQKPYINQDLIDLMDELVENAIEKL